jgi:hypothetical protein
MLKRFFIVSALCFSLSSHASFIECDGLPSQSQLSCNTNACNNVGGTWTTSPFEGCSYASSVIGPSKPLGGNDDEKFSIVQEFLAGKINVNQLDYESLVEIANQFKADQQK